MAPRWSLIASVLFASLRSGLSSGIWPAPAVMIVSAPDNATPVSNSFRFTATGSTSPILSDAFERYLAILKPQQRATDHTVSAEAQLLELKVAVESTNTTLTYAVDESYSLQIAGVEATLSAPTVFGALRGLETFVQLAEHDNTYHLQPAGVPASVNITDRPRFPYRGLMMDTARHFYPVEFIMHILDSMVVSKLNILHMHITDDQSFPMESESVPELTEKGSYGPQYVYSKENVTSLAAYAAARGILLVPEFDMPAHSSSWAAGVPEMMVTNGSGCSTRPFTHGDTMNPTVNVTYDILDKFLSEMIALFPPPFLHLGGDEVPEKCWLSDKDVVAWMARHGMGLNANELESYFVNRVASLSGVKDSGRLIMYWEEILNNNVSLPPHTIIQAWKSDDLPSILAKGHAATNSYLWYLNHGCNNYGDGVWDKFYVNDPYKLAKGATPDQLKLIQGGETTMWGECVDAVIFDAIVWPRAAAAAEQLWSPQHMTTAATDEVAMRLAQHRCRLVGRGVTAAPLDDSSLPRELNPGCQ